MLNTDPRETLEFANMSDDSFNNGYWSDERRGPYYGRVSFNDDEVDEEPEGFEGSFNDENEGI